MRLAMVIAVSFLFAASTASATVYEPPVQAESVKKFVQKKAMQKGGKPLQKKGLNPLQKPHQKVRAMVQKPLQKPHQKSH